MAGIQKGQKRSTGGQYDKRVDDVLKLLLRGHTRSEIIENHNVWKLGERQIDVYIARAKVKMLEINEIDRNESMAMVLKNLWDLFRAARDGGPLFEAHNILRTIAKLKGLEETTVNHIIRERPLVDITDDDLDEAFENHGGH